MKTLDGVTMPRFSKDQCGSLEAQGVRESQRVQFPLLEFYGRTEAKVQAEFVEWKRNYTLKVGLITCVSFFMGQVVAMGLAEFMKGGV